MYLAGLVCLCAADEGVFYPHSIHLCRERGVKVWVKVNDRD